MEKNFWKHVLSVRKHSPLVHNITNYVVMNNTANALLAVGASPVMAHAKSEVVDMTGIADAVLINIGTLDEYWAEAMLITAKTAHSLKKPWVLDPVGVGATSFRDEISQRLLQNRPTVIRGNASEILALGKLNVSMTKGVDSVALSSEAVQAAYNLSDKYGSVVCISGETDIIVNQNKQKLFIKNGDALMTQVTGLGCTASALIAAFVAVVQDKTEATAAAMALLGIAGELSAKYSPGPGSLQANVIDKLYAMTESEFTEQLKFSEE